MTHLSRRALLGLAAALPLAACTSDEPAPPPDPDDALREAAVARERALLALYDTAATADPRLAAVREEHAQHLAALLGAVPSAPPSPAAAPAAAGALLAAEREAAAAHAQAALGASRELAALLASLAASEASHAVVLA